MPNPLDFSNIEGHIEHAVEGVENYAKNMVSPASEQGAEQELKNNETQRAGEQQYSDFLYKNDPQEYREADPVGYVGRKIEDAVTAPMEKNRTPEEESVIEPAAKEVAGAGLSAYGIPQSGTVGKTEGIHEGTVMPEGVAEAEPELDFDHIEGHEIRPAPNTTKELVHVAPKDFISKMGEGPIHSDTVNAYRQRIRGGEDVGPASIHYDGDGNIVGANGRHRALAHLQEGTERMPVEIHRPAPSVKDIQGPPIEKAGIIQNAHKILNHPEATVEDKAIATRQLEHQKETQFEDEKPAGIAYRTDNNGTRWAKTPDSPAEVSIPKSMAEKDVQKYAQEKLDLQKNFAKSRTSVLSGSTKETLPSGVTVKTGSPANTTTIREVEKKLVDSGRTDQAGISRLRKAAMDQYEAQGRPTNLFEDFYAQKLRAYNSTPAGAGSMVSKALSK
jgi:hypothetical protein